MLPADDPTGWITPSALASGGAAGLIAFAIIFIKFMRETQTAFFAALSETRRSCDEAQVRMAEKFAEDSKVMAESAKQAGEESVAAVARMEKSLEALVSELRNKRPPP